MKRLKKGRARRRREKRRRRLSREFCVYLNAYFVSDFGWQPFSVILHDRP